MYFVLYYTKGFERNNNVLLKEKRKLRTLQEKSTDFFKTFDHKFKNYY